MKKLLTLLLVLVLSMGMFTACGDNPNEQSDNPNEPQELIHRDGDVKVTEINDDYKNFKAPEDFKVGLICLHDDKSTYDRNFIDAMDKALAELGLSKDNLVLKTGIDENEGCYNAAVDMADSGCKLIFADSFGHEPFMKQAAEEFSDVEFCHATGTHAHNAGIKNFHNAFASIYEGRYLAGVVAGMKLQEMIDSGKIQDKNKDKDGNIKLGYVGAFPYAEVKSGYTSWFLGVKSIVPNVVMSVRFTGSWYNESDEKTTAEALINEGAAIISQHADSNGAPTACEENGVPNVAYNVDTSVVGPNTALVSSKIDWTPYFKHIIYCAAMGKEIETDWCGTMATGSVVLTDLTKNVANGTAEKIKEVEDDLKSGKIKVFDVNNFTVGGKKLTTAAADIDDDGTFSHETECLINGVYMESVYRSAPSFDIDIDGITIINQDNK